MYPCRSDPARDIIEETRLRPLFRELHRGKTPMPGGVFTMEDLFTRLRGAVEENKKLAANAAALAMLVRKYSKQIPLPEEPENPT